MLDKAMVFKVLPLAWISGFPAAPADDTMGDDSFPAAMFPLKTMAAQNSMIFMFRLLKGEFFLNFSC
ncbi:MAG: hypothetical protein FWG74_02140 [Planctomycetes bacterium]|nr:hypothetical protein [Planctomycetota bacterium]